MRIHHLNCGTMRPAVVGRIVCHVLLCETDDRLVLVDTGFGTADVADPAGRLGPVRRPLRPVLSEEETAARQIDALGFATTDVTDVLLTHLDLDHAGGLSDFPDATVHTTAAEYDAATHPTRREQSRYRSVQWAHGPRMARYDGPGEPWLGFETAYRPEGFGGGFAIVPLPGHTRGHAAVAVRSGDGWLLHAGDAVFHRSSIEPSGGGTSLSDRAARLALLGFERTVAVAPRRVADNHRRLATLAARADVDVTVIPAHDPVVFDRLRHSP